MPRAVYALLLSVAFLGCTSDSPFALRSSTASIALDLGPVRGDAQTVRTVKVRKPINPPAQVELVGEPTGAIVPFTDQLPTEARDGLEFELDVQVTPGGKQTTLHGSFTLRFSGPGSLIADVDVSLEAEVEVPVGLVALDLDFPKAPLGTITHRTLWLRNANQATPVEVRSTSVSEGDFSLEPGHGEGTARANARFAVLIRFVPPALGPAPAAVVTIDTSLGSLSVALSGTGVPPPAPSDPDPDPGPDPMPGPEPEPTTTIFFRSGGSIWTMDADGNQKAVLLDVPSNVVGGLSYTASNELHDAKRWFAARWDPGEDLSDGNPRHELIARAEDGLDVVLWTEADARVAGGGARWAKDDSFISWKVVRPAAGTTAILRADIDWSSGTPVLGTVEEVVSSLLADSSFGFFDWSPDGTRIAYGVQVSGPRRSLFVKDLDTGVVDPLGDDRWFPSWAPDGSRIAFSTGSVGSQGPLAGGYYTIAPDGSNLVTVHLAPEPKAYQSEWSPDSSALAIRQRDNGVFSIVRVPATGGTAVDLTTDIGGNLSMLGWRND